MKFGKTLDNLMVPEWRYQYMNYNVTLIIYTNPKSRLNYKANFSRNSSKWYEMLWKKHPAEVGQVMT